MRNAFYNNKILSRHGIQALRFALLMLCIVAYMPSSADGWGVPFLRNYQSTEYNAHSRNYDVACDEHGTVYVANFEGLLYYDGSSWRKIHTPGISRVTRIALGENGRVWVGGYDIFGYVEADDKGVLHLSTIVSDDSKVKISEVDFIKVNKQSVVLHTTSGLAYSVKNDKELVPIKDYDKSLFTNAEDSVSTLSLPLGVKLNYSISDGMKIKHGGALWIPVTENDGLTSNAVNYITYDKKKQIWGATERGVFCLEAVSPFSKIDEHQGLKGGVNCIEQIGNTVFIGTLEGLYSFSGTKLKKVEGISLACWQLIHTSSTELLAATTDGLFIVTEQRVRRISDDNTFSVCLTKTPGLYVTGEIDGVYLTYKDGKRKKISYLEKVTKLKLNGGIIIAESIYGEQWHISFANTNNAKCIRKKVDSNAPRLEYADAYGRTWKTDHVGYNLKVEGGNSNETMQAWLHPLGERIINVLFVDGNGKLWAGGDFGVIISDIKSMTKEMMADAERPYIRQITILGDSVVWGGYDKDGLTPRHILSNINLPSYCNRIVIYYSTRTNSLVNPTKYRYRVNDGTWSAWSEETQVRFNNIVFGKMNIEIQAMDMFGRTSEISKAELYVHFPYYLRWWAVLIYLLLIGIAIMAFMRWRTRRLEVEKEKLENVVAERTAELSTTLDELRQTQDDLVRMERSATAGKLTQGLIDRILNPINYINNFSHLTTGLAKDLREDIEDEKEAISEDNYEDCQDILDMMTQNLQKIEQHGINTTRTLRAMEAMLNNHVGNLTMQDIRPLCHQVIEVSSEYHKALVERYDIKLRTVLPEEPVKVNMDAESMNKVLISLINNSIYAIAKKYDQTPYEPMVTLSVSRTEEDKVRISIHDNGIGIEDQIKEKVFDPFFTTKPTGEAAGVSLYLVHDIVNDHKGTITMESVKNEFCEFVITL